MTLETEELRRELKNYGFIPGPITETTRKLYIWKLNQLRKCTPNVTILVPQNIPVSNKVYSNELSKALQNRTCLSNLIYRQLEKQMVTDFANNTENFREGYSKSCFTYLLLDSRLTKNLPDRAASEPKEGLWKTFLSAIFYIGKGKRCRPFDHLMDAIPLHRNGTKMVPNAKLQRILDIWNSNKGVICLHVFQNVIPAEAYTREAAMISALRLENLENKRIGDFYGVSRTWPANEQQKLGVFLLYNAYKIFLREGERELFSSDIE